MLQHVRKILLTAAVFAGLANVCTAQDVRAQNPVAETAPPEDIFADEPLERRSPQEERAAERASLRGRLDPEETVPERAQEGRARRDGSLSAEQTSVLDIKSDDVNLKDGSLVPRNLEPQAQLSRIAREQPPLGVDEELPGEPEEVDPYEPLGVRFGSFLLFPELHTESVYRDNIFLSPTNPEGDWALALTPSLTARSDWNRHSLEGTVSGVRSFHERFSSEDDKTFSVQTRGQLDVRRDTNVVTSAGYTQALEDRSSNDFPANAEERPETRTTDASLEGNHTFNRLTATLRGEVSEQDFGSARATDGTIINNDDRDYTERRLVGRLSYELQPGIAAFVEASGNERDFVQEVDSSGVRSNSSGHDVQGGLSFKLSGKLTGEVSAGYAIQTPDDPSLKDVDGLIFNAGLEWKASGLTTVRLDADSEVAETVQTGTAGSITRAVEVSVEHRPRRHIVLGALLGYERETFSGISQTDEDWTVGLSGEYIFTPSVALTVDYEHLESTSSVPGSDYTVDEVRMGLRLRR